MKGKRLRKKTEGEENEENRYEKVNERIINNANKTENKRIIGRKLRKLRKKIEEAKEEN